MKKFTLIFFITVGLFTHNLNAQILHELGIIAGPVSMQTDYGERGDVPSSYGNIGFGAGVVYYLSFKSRASSWNDRGGYVNERFRARLEFSYMKDNFTHRGSYIDGNSAQSILLKGMTGSTKLLNYGGQLEINLLNASDMRKINPYVSLGILYTSFDPEIESVFGDIEENPNLIPNVYHGGVYLEKNNTSSLIFGGGTRYNLKNNLKMLFDFRWQRFSSNRVDGIEPQISADKFNEWLIFLNVGIIFNLN